MMTIAPHPLLCVEVFETVFPAPLGELDTPSPILDRLRTPPGEERPDTKAEVRAMLRYGGFKPSGRSKPAWEYLDKACREGSLGSINPAVDFCNAFSLHGGLPISVVDLDLAAPPFRIDLAEPGTSYVFNPSGQIMDLSGLISLFDVDGPCAGPVKDSQRTKTGPSTHKTLTVVWGTVSLAEHTRRLAADYRRALGEWGAVTERGSVAG